MRINKIWDEFAGKIAEIELLYTFINDSSSNEVKRIIEYANSLEDKPELKEFSSSHHSMAFYDAITGKRIFYNHAVLSLEERHLNIFIRKNKQYQWLLAEAYEEFEDYLEKIYAFYGSIDNSFWPLRDYGNISLSQLSSKNYEWYVVQAKKKKDTPKSILSEFRKQLPRLKLIESRNKLKINLTLAITLIEKMRHIIVHKGGRVDNKKDFVNLVVKESGLYNNGNISDDNRNFINKFFGDNEYENLITILEIPIESDIPLDIHISLFTELIRYLMAYAFILYKFIQQKLQL